MRFLAYRRRLYLCLGGGAPISSSGSLSVHYSIVQNGFVGVGNLDVDPMFVDAPGGDLSLQAGSTAIDAGSTSLLAGRSR